MALIKREYELSVWKESLADGGQKKVEQKMAIIGAHDMGFQGKATKIKFTTKINGTHTLVFEMPDMFFDNKSGEFIHNELIDELFNECKIKFFYKKKWYEFYIKDIKDTKKFKSYIKTYTCTDSFIDELSRNGYGITFNEDLYNNVDEIGVFSKEVLDGSTWEYDSTLNWGDFTEFIEEKLFKIPLSLFPHGLTAYKLNYQVDGNILNIYTNETRACEMGDDYAREQGIFWNQYGNEIKHPILSDSVSIGNSGYIYVPYSQLSFCLISTDYESGLDESLLATEEPGYYSNKSYAIAPQTIDPSSLIQFMYIPEGAQVEIDESGLIVNKDYTYVITLKEWNEQLHTEYFYKFEDYYEIVNGHRMKLKKLEQISNPADSLYQYGNKALYYDGYLDSINDIYVEKGKKIVISNRTELNNTEEIDQYVSVYNNQSIEYKQMFTNDDWAGAYNGYRVCSKTDTRLIIPSLARNLVQNGNEIKSTVGWELMKSGEYNDTTANEIVFSYTPDEPSGTELDKIVAKGVKESYLVYKFNGQTNQYQCSVVNFGIIGQEKTIEKNKIYALGINVGVPPETIEEVNGWSKTNITIKIGEGYLVSDGEYNFSNANIIQIRASDLDRGFILFKSKIEIKNPYIAIYSQQSYRLISLKLFEAYTKGIDFFEDGKYRYSGRELGRLIEDFGTITEQPLYYRTNSMTEEKLRQYILFEDDVMDGDTYGYERYFIQQLQLNDGTYYDTFGQKEFLSEDGGTDSLPLDSSIYSEDDYEVITNYINLNDCQYYNALATTSQVDCSCESNITGVCLYQKYGYCPYLFEKEMHCRKVRTLKGEKSNRFNLTQEIGKLFEAYPMYHIEHNTRGDILTQQQAYDIGKRYQITDGRADWADKRVFYIKEKGKENIFGFRYEKNLSNISRQIASDKIVSKLYVLDVDSTLSSSGLCTIKTAQDNPSKDSFIFDFRYYTSKGIINEDELNADLYGVDESDLGFLKQLGYYNEQYDILSDKIINLDSASFTELQAKLEVNLTGIETSQKLMKKIQTRMLKYVNADNHGGDYEKNKTYISCQNEYAEEYSNYLDLITSTFYTNGTCGRAGNPSPEHFLDNYSIQEIRDNELKNHNYFFGLLGQFNKQYNQITTWKKQQAVYLKQINKLSDSFYKKYEPYIKEGTWSNSNYLDNNQYYYDATKVAKEGSIPQVKYTISVIDIEPLYQDGDYDFDVADRTWVEDIGMFGINPKTGFPNRLKTLISSITEEPDFPKNDKIDVQDFTTQFEDLFQQVSATVQNLTFNENIYMRSSNFTAQQGVKTESLQTTLDNNDLTLVKTAQENIKIDWQGQSGSDINNHNNKYKLDGQGLSFSNDGGQSWLNVVSPNGINADYIRAGTLDAGRVRIVDGNYIYFTWDANGICAYREPTTGKSPLDDYAQFNKYGLSLVEDGKIKLRAGYEFLSTKADGKVINESNDITDRAIGFYLYNSEGSPIFATENSSSSETAALETARIKLVGEILASNDKNMIISNTLVYGGVRYEKSTTITDYCKITNINLLQPPSYTVNFTNNKWVLVIDANTDETKAVCSWFYELYNQDSSFESAIQCGANIYSNFNIYSSASQKWIKIISTSPSQYTFGDILTLTFDVDDGNNITHRTYSGVFIKGRYEDDDPYAEHYYVINQSDVSFETDENTISYRSIVMGDDYNNYGKELSSENSIEGVIITEENSYGYPTYIKQTISNLYFDDVRSYYTEEKSQETGNVGRTALYINNRADLEAEDVQDTSRLFVCCRDKIGDTQEVSNIFSILKDGSLYMGGNIRNAGGGDVSATTLDDYIVIDNPYFVIDNNGAFKMDLSKIIDINTGQSLVDAVITDEELTEALLSDQNFIRQLATIIRTWYYD